MKTVVIDGVTYAPLEEMEMGEIQIVVLERGFVYIGYFENDGKTVTIRGARAIIRWGTSAHLGELQGGPLTNTKLGQACTVRCLASQIIHCVEVNQDVWTKYFNG